jgi:hypothetical protein
MIANLQYGWTLFIAPIDAKHQWGRAPIQIAFTIFIVTETWVAPFAGYLVPATCTDLYGRKFASTNYRAVQRSVFDTQQSM